jgi:hypothetical protein
MMLVVNLGSREIIEVSSLFNHLKACSYPFNDPFVSD